MKVTKNNQKPAMIIYIDDDPRKDLELFDCLYNLKNKGEIDYKLDEKEHRVTIKAGKLLPVINDEILGFYLEKDKVFYGVYGDNNDISEKLISYEDWWSDAILTAYKNYLESDKVSNIWDKIEDYGEGLFTSTWKFNGRRKF